MITAHLLKFEFCNYHQVETAKIRRVFVTKNLTSTNKSSESTRPKKLAKSGFSQGQVYTFDIFGAIKLNKRNFCQKWRKTRYLVNFSLTFFSDRPLHSRLHNFKLLINERLPGSKVNPQFYYSEDLV